MSAIIYSLNLSNLKHKKLILLTELKIIQFANKFLIVSAVSQFNSDKIMEKDTKEIIRESQHISFIRKVNQSEYREK